jgi:hypothetical protein
LTWKAVLLYKGLTLKPHDFAPKREPMPKDRNRISNLERKIKNAQELTLRLINMIDRLLNDQREIAVVTLAVVKQMRKMEKRDDSRNV